MATERTAGVSQEFIQCGGRWDNNRDHGIQFKTTFLKVMPPSSIDGIEKYLGSGMIRGIGPHFARKMVDAFGEDVFDVIGNEPDRMLKLDGIGPNRVERITAGWADQKAIREIMVFGDFARIAGKLSEIFTVWLMRHGGNPLTH